MSEGSGPVFVAQSADADVRADAERLAAAETFCWHVITLMHFGASADEILHSANDLQTWANLAARDGILHDDDPDGRIVSQAIPYPDGPTSAHSERSEDAQTKDNPSAGLVVGEDQ